MDWIENFMDIVDGTFYSDKDVREMFMSVHNGGDVLKKMGNYVIIDGNYVYDRPKDFKNHRAFNPPPCVECSRDRFSFYLVSESSEYAKNRLLGRLRAKLFLCGEVYVESIDKTADKFLLDNDEIILSKFRWPDALVTAVEEIVSETGGERITLNQKLSGIAKRLDYTLDESSKKWIKESNYS